MGQYERDYYEPDDYNNLSHLPTEEEDDEDLINIDDEIDAWMERERELDDDSDSTTWRETR